MMCLLKYEQELLSLSFAEVERCKNTDFCFVVIEILGKSIDNFGYERSWLRSVKLLCSSDLRNMFVLHFYLSLSPIF